MGRTYTEDELLEHGKEFVRAILATRLRPGRKPSVRSEPPADSQQRKMRARAAFLLPEVKAARRLPAQHAVERLQKLAASEIPGLARRLSKLGIYHERSTNTYHVGTTRPKDIVIWMVANEFKVSLPITKKILSGIRS